MFVRQHEAIPLLDHALAPLSEFMNDDSVEDIIMNRPNEAFIRRGAVTTRHDVDMDFIDQQGIAILAAALKGQNVGKSTPLLSCELPGGTRLQAVLPPCVGDGKIALAIRRAKSVAPTLDQLAGGGIFATVEPLGVGQSPEIQKLVQLYHEANQATGAEAKERAWTEFLKATMKARLTHVMCGEVGSGKTYFGMGLANEIPLEDRIVTIQDSDEWASLPHPNRTDLFYSKGGQGAANVTPTDLVEASLRLAMKWLLLQELRGAEAFSFLRARRSGHPGLTTCHAASTRDVFPTLAAMVKQAPAYSTVEPGDIEQTLKTLIDVVIHFHRPDGRFAVSEVWFGPAERAAA